MQEKHEVIKERLRFVRERMKAENVDIFVVFTDDYHMSEYSGAYFADREYLSGFTGSAGTLAVTQTEAALFTDGRYFVQAQAQLEGTGITLMKMGCAGVPTLTEYIRERLGAGGVLGMDARTCVAQTGSLERRSRASGVKLGAMRTSTKSLSRSAKCSTSDSGTSRLTATMPPKALLGSQAKARS